MVLKKKMGRGIIEKEYGVVVLGTGIAGRTFAGKVARAALKIAIVDSREYGAACHGVFPEGLKKLWQTGN